MLEIRDEEGRLWLAGFTSAETGHLCLPQLAKASTPRHHRGRLLHAWPNGLNRQPPGQLLPVKHAMRKPPVYVLYKHSGSISRLNLEKISFRQSKSEQRVGAPGRRAGGL